MRGLVERHPAGRWLFNLTLILAAFALLAFLERGNAADNRQARRDFCVELEQVRAYARDAARRGLKTVPTLAYYKSHPAEKARAIADIKRQIRFFSPPLNCDRFAEELPQ